MTLHLCQAGYEAFLVKELGGKADKTGPGWVLGPDAKGESCFAHLSVREPKELEGKSVNALSGEIADFFTGSTKEERFEGPWPFCVESSGEAGLGRRTKTVADECFERIRGRMSRVAKLAVQGRPALGASRGLFVYLPTFDRAFVGREAIAGGQRRMADDSQAPSRSYLKVEEAYAILGREPGPGETVVDLGAAPGGWSYSAARRGALVTAVDNGPMKSGGLHPGITHKTEDAFLFAPEKPVDWLFCDMVEDPERIVLLVERWLKEGWCRRLVVNLKFGRTDPVPLLRRAEILRQYIPKLMARHLFHDREEFTLVGECAV